MSNCPQTAPLHRKDRADCFRTFHQKQTGSYLWLSGQGEDLLEASLHGPIIQ